VSIMDRTSVLIVAAAALIAACILPAIAARGPEQVPITPTRVEILVFETEDCLYCQIFRRDVLPQYEVSKRARVAPIRFLNATTADPKKLGLDAPISMLPTVVVMREGRERGRITGYLGPEPFFHMVTRIIRTTN
jgi:Thioredoxin-like domain